MSLDFFYLGVVFIIAHQLDAMRCKEWQMIPILSSFSDQTARAFYVLMHIPLLYILLLEGLKLENESFQKGLNYFLIIHLIIHNLLLKHPKNGFTDEISWFLISGAALCGFLDLFL